MTDDLMTRLDAAGELLDRRGAEALDAVTVDDGARVLPLTPVPPAHPRRVPVLWGVAAAFLLVVGAVAVVAWNQRDDATPVASAPSIVALVPGAQYDDWDVNQAEQHRLGDAMTSGLVGGPNDMVIAVPGDAVDDPSRSVMITVLADVADDQGRVDVDGADDVSGSGRSGQLAVDPDVGRTQLFVDTDPDSGSRDVLLLATGRSVSVDELLALAGSIELGSPLEGQTLADGWIVRATQGAHVDTTVRALHLSTSVPMTYRSEWLSVTSFAGASDDLRWIVAEPYLASETVVRGKPAWLVLDPWRVTLTWMEAPGLVAQLSYNTSEGTDDERLAAALDHAERLDAVDQAAWDRFAEQAPVEPDGGWTTTTVQGTDGGAPAFDFEGVRAEHAMSGGLDDGGWYHLWTDRDTGEMCWEVSIDPGLVTCEEPAVEADGSRAEYVGTATDPDGRPVLVFGWLPETGTFADVLAEGPDDRVVSLGAGSAGDAIWSAAVPPGYRPVQVTFAKPGGQVVSTIELGERRAP